MFYPVMPHELIKVRPRHVAEIILQHQVQIATRFSPDDIERIVSQHKNLLNEYHKEHRLKLAIDRYLPDISFEDFWSIHGLKGKFPLCDFCGGLSSVFPNTASESVEADFSDIMWESDEFRTSLTSFSLEGILHSFKNQVIRQNATKAKFWFHREPHSTGRGFFWKSLIYRGLVIKVIDLWKIILEGLYLINTEPIIQNKFLKMDEKEFFVILEQFPRVKTSSYVYERSSSNAVSSTENALPQHPSTAKAVSEENESFSPVSTPRSIEKGQFWEKFQNCAEEKLPPGEAKEFCLNFKKNHNRLVYECLSLDSIERIASVNLK